MASTDWNPVLRGELDQPYWNELQSFVATERATQVVYPASGDVFAALARTPYASVKVVILGQDPYHGPRQANGLAFSVSTGVPVPPSLKNIFTELVADIGCSMPRSGDLSGWAEQGVLLLNATLTVRAGHPASHQKRGWETFTDAVLRAVSDRGEPSIFMLWGSSARRKSVLLDATRHHVIESVHPSPLSAYRGFFGSRPFSRANAFLEANGRNPIDWSKNER